MGKIRPGHKGLLVNSRTNQIADNQLADWSTREHLLNKHGFRELTFPQFSLYAS